MELSPLPACFDRFREMGGALQFTLFEGGEGACETAINAISASLEDVDAAELAASGGRRIDVNTFLGDWADPTSRALFKRGRWIAEDGRELIDAPLASLEGVRLVSGVDGMPTVGGGGQFAYAFLCPPYPLLASPLDIQETFDSILSVLLPPSETCEVTDWSSPGLFKVSPFFAAGMEWWGVFLFTIWQVESRRLIVIAGSATD